MIQFLCQVPITHKRAIQQARSSCYCYTDSRFTNPMVSGLAAYAMKRCSMKRKSTASDIQSLSDCVRTRTRKAWSRNTETKPNFYWVHSWWWFRAQTSALQQATPFLGATKREAATIPPMAIRRNTSTLNGTFTGDRCFPSSVVSSDARRGKHIARTCDSEWSHGTAAPVLSALRPTH